MSGLKSIPLGNFYRSLHARGLDVTELARQLNCGRSHLSQVLNGSRSGSQTWRKIERAGILTEKELTLLGRSQLRPQGADGVPRETLSHVEQQPAA